jgi:hypothetical protein
MCLGSGRDWKAGCEPSRPRLFLRPVLAALLVGAQGGWIFARAGLPLPWVLRVPDSVRAGTPRTRADCR